MTTVTRRRLLTALGATAAVATTGCLGDRRGAGDYATVDPPAFDDPDDAGVVEAFFDVPYRETPAGPLVLDFYRPAGAGAGAGEGDDRRPLVVRIHGGGWSSGDQAWDEQGRADAAAGLAVASVAYRLSDVARYPAAVRDVVAAVTWLRTDAARVAGVDPERVVLVGESAGAHLAALVAVAPDVAALRPVGVAPSVSGIRGVVGVSGVYDLTVPVAGRNADVRAFLGCEQADCPDRYAAASPISHLDAGDPPHLVYHGTDDEVVPYANATAYRDRLRALGVPVTLVTGAGGGHVDPYAGPWADRMASARAAFLRERLDLDP